VTRLDKQKATISFAFPDFCLVDNSSTENGHFTRLYTKAKEFKLGEKWRPATITKNGAKPKSQTIRKYKIRKNEKN